MKIAYTYDPKTKEFTGAMNCFESPLERGEYITPAHCLFNPPPPPRKGKGIFYDGKKGWKEVDTPRPSKEELLESEVAAYRLAVRKHMSRVASEQPERFNSISEAKSYTGVENPYMKISQAFVVWGASVQFASNEKLDAVLKGKSKLPKIEDHIESLPKFTRPEGT